MGQLTPHPLEDENQQRQGVEDKEATAGGIETGRSHFEGTSRRLGAGLRRLTVAWRATSPFCVLYRLPQICLKTKTRCGRLHRLR